MKAFIALACFFASAVAVSQTNDQAPSLYHSEADTLVTIDKVSYAPFFDNLNGIYARPLESHFADVLNQMHRWSTGAPVNINGATIDELEENPQAVKEAAAGTDGFFAVRISKGPKGIAMKLDFFLAKDGRLLLQSEVKDFQQFDLNLVREQLDSLFTHMLHEIPYSGRVLSRDLNRVTVNVGSRDGLEKGQVLSVIQIVKLNRHPRFGFLVNAEKEIIGKIKVLKVDDTLSFGSVVMEKERGAVEKGSKLDSLEFVSYAVNDASLSPNPEGGIDQRSDSKVAFGKNARAWKPLSEASLGQVGGRFGLARFNESADISNGAVTAHDDFAPMVFLDGELWITSTWTIHAAIKEGIFSVSANGNTISESLSAYEMLVGYRFRFGPTPWSPYAEPFLGYMTYRLYADTTTPATFTTMQYNGFKIGVQGACPITEDDEWSVGGSIAFILSPSLTETPYSSGSSSTNSVNQFSLWVTMKMTEHWKAQANIDIEEYSSNFSGSGTRPAPGTTANSASQEYLPTLSGGVYYMF